MSGGQRMYEMGCKCPETPCPYHPTPNRPFVALDTSIGICTVHNKPLDANGICPMDKQCICVRFYDYAPHHKRCPRYGIKEK